MYIHNCIYIKHPPPPTNQPLDTIALLLPPNFAGVLPHICKIYTLQIFNSLIPGQIPLKPRIALSSNYPSTLLPSHHHHRQCELTVPNSRALTTISIPLLLPNKPVPLPVQTLSYSTSNSTISQNPQSASCLSLSFVYTASQR